jgi:hypothetical protein
MAFLQVRSSLGRSVGNTLAGTPLLVQGIVCRCEPVVEDPPHPFKLWQRVELAVLAGLTAASLALHVAFGTGHRSLLLFDLVLFALLVHVATWMGPMLRDRRQEQER